MLPRFAYAQPSSIREALDLLASGNASVHAGGSDLLGCLHDQVFPAETVVSLSALESLRGIRRRADGWLEIGAMTTISEIAVDPTVRSRYPGLAQAAESVASPQLRNQGTLGGNLCQRPRCWYFRGEFECAKKGGDVCFAVDGENRYHAIFGGGPCYIVHPSDTAPMLLALDAQVRVADTTGELRLALDDFFVLPEDDLYRENVLRPGQIVTAVEIPPAPEEQLCAYRKVRERGAWDFALTSLAVALEVSSGKVAGGRMVFGGVAPIPWRSLAAEEAVAGRPLTPDVIAAAANAAVAGAEPLEQNAYKVLLVKGLVEEVLTGA